MREELNSKNVFPPALFWGVGVGGGGGRGRYRFTQDSMSAAFVYNICTPRISCDTTTAKTSPPHFRNCTVLDKQTLAKRDE